MATIFPTSPTIGDQYGGYEWNGTAWIIIGIDLTQDYITQAEFDGLIDSAPDALNTLNELAAAIGDDANFFTTVTDDLATKAPLNSPTFTGTVTVPEPTNSTDASTKFYVDNNSSGIAPFFLIGT